MIALSNLKGNIQHRVRQHNEAVAKKRAEAAYALIGDVEGRRLDEQQLNCIVKKAHNHLVIAGAGTGKTTTVGKLANLYRTSGKTVLVAAADTFRAAATEQLLEWTKRAKVPCITGHEGADPGAVVYDAIQAAKARDVDILMIDTAGRLNNKKNLMKELSKIYKIIAREYGYTHLETLLVLDGTTGQNALMQARDFEEIAAITGIVLTKLDGTAKGGIAIAIQSEMGFPVKYIGVGEKIDDMQRFNPDEFVDALFANSGSGEDTEE
jgi:fused signal recognition particle receptor